MDFHQASIAEKSHEKILHQTLPSSGAARENLRAKGQFWTPEWVAEAMTYYVLLDKSPILFDPSVGEGIFYKTAKKLSDELGYTPKLLGYEVDCDVLKQARKNGLSAEDSANVKIADFVLNPPQQKMSAIVANPPYIRHHRLDEGTKNSLKNMAARITGFSLDGRAGYHIYFLIYKKISK